MFARIIANCKPDQSEYTPAELVSKSGAHQVSTEGGNALNIDNYGTLQAAFGLPVAIAAGAPK